MGPPISEIRLLQNFTTFKTQGQGDKWGQSSPSHSGSNILSTTTSFIPYQSTLPFLRYGDFKLWPCKFNIRVDSQSVFAFLRYFYFKTWHFKKSKVKVMGEVKYQYHTADTACIQCISFFSFTLVSLSITTIWSIDFWQKSRTKNLEKTLSNNLKNFNISWAWIREYTHVLLWSDE